METVHLAILLTVRCIWQHTEGSKQKCKTFLNIIFLFAPKSQSQTTLFGTWTWTHLAREGCSFRRLEEVTVHLVGPCDHRGNRLLVLRRGGSQQRQRGEGNVVLAVGQAALIITVWTQAARKGQGYMGLTVQTTATAEYLFCIP